MWLIKSVERKELTSMILLLFFSISIKTKSLFLRMFFLLIISSSKAMLLFIAFSLRRFISS